MLQLGDSTTADFDLWPFHSFYRDPAKEREVFFNGFSPSLACNGDSGTPVVFKQKWLLVGITATREMLQPGTPCEAFAKWLVAAVEDSKEWITNFLSENVYSSSDEEESSNSSSEGEGRIDGPYESP